MYIHPDCRASFLDIYIIIPASGRAAITSNEMKNLGKVAALGSFILASASLHPRDVCENERGAFFRDARVVDVIPHR